MLGRRAIVDGKVCIHSVFLNSYHVITILIWNNLIQDKKRWVVKGKKKLLGESREGLVPFMASY
jgi:hypothetical protein